MASRSCSTTSSNERLILVWFYHRLVTELTIDLNVDAGESYGAWRMGDDEALFAAVSTANLACGFHAGDPGTIRTSLAAAIAAGVAVGAHPGLPDLAGFGRRPMSLTPQEAHDD